MEQFLEGKGKWYWDVLARWWGKICSSKMF